MATSESALPQDAGERAAAKKPVLILVYLSKRLRYV